MSKDILTNILRAIPFVAIASLLYFYYAFIKEAKIRIVGKKYLDKDQYGIYNLTFHNKGPKEGLIEKLDLKIGKKRCFILDESGRSIDFPVRLSRNAYFTCIINVQNILQDCETDKLRSLIFFRNKKCYKAYLSYSVTSGNKTKNLKYRFYLLDNIDS